MLLTSRQLRAWKTPWRAWKMVAMCLAVLATLLASSPALAAHPPAAPRPAAGEPHDGGRRGTGTLDGFVISRLPAGLGPLVTDFEYEWGGVAHRSRVWERGPDDAGAYQVDLTVKILRGQRLRTLASLRSYLADYHERDLDQWELEPFRHLGKPGYRNDAEAFWLDGRGVAVEVRFVNRRFNEDDLMQTVRGIRPADA
jgi:hypothetical protein